MCLECHLKPEVCCQRVSYTLREGAGGGDRRTGCTAVGGGHGRPCLLSPFVPLLSMQWGLREGAGASGAGCNCPYLWPLPTPYQGWASLHSTQILPNLDSGLSANPSHGCACVQCQEKASESAKASHCCCHLLIICQGIRNWGKHPSRASLLIQPLDFLKLPSRSHHPYLEGKPLNLLKGICCYYFYLTVASSLQSEGHIPLYFVVFFLQLSLSF